MGIPGLIHNSLDGLKRIIALTQSVGMIQSFATKETEKFWLRTGASAFDPRLAERAYRKLQIIDAAAKLSDLSSLPGNKLEKLRGDREGQYSIRINKQWRVCFSWSEQGPQDVEIIDYH